MTHNGFCADWKPRPAAQDAEECSVKEVVAFTKWFNSPDCPKDAEYDDLLAAFKLGLSLRRPSRPMSAEVEKAIDDRPTREQYAKWVAFYITAIDDKEARACGCVKDGLDMLRGLYEKEVAALKEKV